MMNEKDLAMKASGYARAVMNVLGDGKPKPLKASEVRRLLDHFEKVVEAAYYNGHVSGEAHAAGARRRYARGPRRRRR